MDPAVLLGAATGAGLLMFLFALILLGLLALIPALRKPYGLRHTLAWLLSSLLYGWLIAFNTPIATLLLASVLSGVLMALRYWWATRRTRKTA